MVSGQANCEQQCANFGTEFAQAKGARLQGSHPVGQVGSVLGERGPRDGDSLALPGRWMAGWATLLRGWHRWVDSRRVTLELGSQRDHKQQTKHTGTRQGRTSAYLPRSPSVRGMYSVY